MPRLKGGAKHVEEVRLFDLCVEHARDSVRRVLPIESNMAGIPGLKTYAENPSMVTVLAAITEAQKELLRAEGMTLANNLAVNGRSMISVLSILVARFNQFERI